MERIPVKGANIISFRPPKTIVLVGLMGAGKTSIGKRLARRLGLPFYDSDLEIEKAAGRSCKEVFELFGEEEFRQGEKRIIFRLLEMPVHVLSTGGGAFAHQDIQQIIQEKGISIWLKADLPTLIERVSRRTDRPMLGNGNEKVVLEKLIEERYPLYQQADITVETFIEEPTTKTTNRVIDKLGEFIQVNFPSQYILMKS